MKNFFRFNQFIHPFKFLAACVFPTLDHTTPSNYNFSQLHAHFWGILRYTKGIVVRLLMVGCIFLAMLHSMKLNFHSKPSAPNLCLPFLLHSLVLRYLSCPKVIHHKLLQQLLFRPLLVSTP